MVLTIIPLGELGELGELGGEMPESVLSATISSLIGAAEQQVSAWGWVILAAISLCAACSLIYAWALTRDIMRHTEVINAFVDRRIRELGVELRGAVAVDDAAIDRKLKKLGQAIRDVNGIIFAPLLRMIIFGLIVPTACVVAVIALQSFEFTEKYQIFATAELSSGRGVVENIALLMGDEVAHAASGVVVNSLEWTISPIHPNRQNIIFTVIMATLFRANAIAFAGRAVSIAVYVPIFLARKPERLHKLIRQYNFYKKSRRTLFLNRPRHYPWRGDE